VENCAWDPGEQGWGNVETPDIPGAESTVFTGSKADSASSGCGPDPALSFLPSQIGDAEIKFNQSFKENGCPGLEVENNGFSATASLVTGTYNVDLVRQG
jgi:hypothetical protein